GEMLDEDQLIVEVVFAPQDDLVLIHPSLQRLVLAAVLLRDVLLAAEALRREIGDAHPAPVRRRGVPWRGALVPDVGPRRARPRNRPALEPHPRRVAVDDV